MTEEIAVLVPWQPFEVDGRALYWSALRTRTKSRPHGWPANKPSPGRWEPIVLVIVRATDQDDDAGVGKVYPAGIEPTVEHAIETARVFASRLG